MYLLYSWNYKLIKLYYVLILFITVFPFNLLSILDMKNRWECILLGMTLRWLVKGWGWREGRLDEKKTSYGTRKDGKKGSRRWGILSFQHDTADPWYSGDSSLRKSAMVHRIHMKHDCNVFSYPDIVSTVNYHRPL